MLTKHGIAVGALSLLLVLAGCTAPMVEPELGDGGVAGGPSDTSVIASPDANFTDPADDPLGWEDGYWYNESIAVDQSDGLSDTELRAYVARSMARVEYLRHKEFKKRVSVDILSREEYQEQQRANAQNGSAAGNQTEFNQWNNQVWEALFISGESGDSQAEISETQGSSVAGFYSPSNDAITVITPSPDSPRIDNATLIHELTHALQDQHYDLTSQTYRGDTQDRSLAIDGAVEGDAKYVELLYADRCGIEWECVETPPATGAGGSAGSAGNGPNLGIFLTIFQPYSDGPVYVHDKVQQGGWQAIDELLRNPPESTEQTIHSTDEKPVPIEYQDRSTNGWATFPQQGQDGSDTVGEVSMYAMFWYQARMSGAETIPSQSILRTESQYDTYNYDAAPSNGWGNDRLFPYKNSVNGSDEYGYVWVTEWDSKGDAQQFYDAYVNILDAHDATKQSKNTWVVESGQFADSFRVQQDGTRVTIVNGPTVEDVDDIRPPAN
ncbi:hypothetical protein C499_10554 [Halogeometricum borinquense DSM 11551]|uniref:Lipoprotein n=2 Tax=Halogeometricum borinquense TaxID=60847 RepID=E4NKV9_HALBP|nr:Hvo_1808 family surface protein [Halogeometricum borinquense]ADQ66005.1 hypothetical protein Hbor_04010 [Halogeometricum borinquense DSM 11551]ELY27498.1 hypothetical protein C499_10554 [Halogeometricum borinquense DSM 11551]RYJ19579.1 hypothetical protein ELS19_00885 [Halogeometricum borinquense]